MEEILLVIKRNSL